MPGVTPDGEREAAGARDPIALSVVVMGHHDGATIPAAVGSLLGQCGAERVQVVVVTSGGDGSAAAVRAAFPDVEVVDVTERLLPGGARNLGVAHARGEIVAFLAGDCEATPGWVAGRLAAHRAGHPVVASAVSTGRPQTPSAWAQTFQLYCTRLPGHPAGSVAHDDPAAHGLSFTRLVLDRLGSFPADVEYGEDTAMLSRLADLGIPVWFAPTVVAAHHGPPTLRALCTDVHRRGLRSGRLAQPRLRLSDAWRTLPGEWWGSQHWILRTAWRNAGPLRGRLVRTLPWLLVAHGAWFAGRCRGRLARPTIPT